MKGMIALKYSERYSGSKKGNSTGIYILIACCLLIVGGAAWFALSNMADTPSTKPNDEPSRENSYDNGTSSYTESVEDRVETPIITENVAESVENEPYSSVEETAPKEESYCMPVEGEVIKHYNLEQLQYSTTYGDMRIHSGIDIACKNGTAVSSCGDGVVKTIENSAELGTTVVIDHKNGLTFKYSALKELKVEVGSRVKTGDIIGTVTTIPSECNDQNHIHLEALKDGKSISPLKALDLE